MGYNVRLIQIYEFIFRNAALKVTLLTKNILSCYIICPKTGILHKNTTRKHVNEIKKEPGYSVSA